MSTTNKATDRGPDGRLRRKYRRLHSPHFPRGTPKWWRKLYMTRPKRRENKRVCCLIVKRADPDEVVPPLGNRKPHVYYW